MSIKRKISFGDELDYLYENGVDLKNRIIYVTDHSSDCSDSSEKKYGIPLNYNSVVKSLLYLSTIDRNEPIKIVVNSYGGDVYEALSLFDAINLIPNKTIGLGIGIIASGASLVLAACVERYLTCNSFIMIHEVSSNLDGKHTDQKNEIIHQEKILDRMCGIYSKTLNISANKIKELLKKDYYMSSDEALNIGFIKKVIDDKKKLMSII